MQGTIGIDNLEISCLIGCNPEEQTNKQKIFIDLKVELVLSAAIKSDHLQDTLNYSNLAAVCNKLAQNKHQLIEHLASEILETVLTADRVVWAQIRIKKPSAIPNAQWAYVELERHR